MKALLLTLRTLVIGLSLLGGLANLSAQSTAFTYQGQLHDTGAPASGSYDLRFTIYDAVTGGSVIAGPITNSAVIVSNGYFTVTLDFGAGIFTGAPRWLELGAATNGSGSFETLSPLQELSPTPYAMFAGNSANVGSGAAVKSLNGLLDDVTLAAGANVTITPSGNTLTIASSGAGGSGIWNLNGVDAYYTGGKVGIGTTTPRGALHVASGGLAVTGASSPYSGAGGGVFMEWGGTVGNLFAFDYGAFISKPLILNAPGGNVGIGTATPASKLTIRTGNSVFSGYGFEHTDGTVRLATFIDTGYGAWLGTRTAHALNFFVNDGLPSMTINADGSVSTISGPGVVTIGSPNAESGSSIQRSGNRADVRFNGSSLKLVAGPGSGPPSSFNGIAVTTGGNVGIGTDVPLAKLDVRGTTRTCILTIVGGCDLAEPFPLKDEQIAKGSVVVIDEDHPGRLMQSEQAYDKRVAGIISGANGVNPGITLQQEGTFDQGQNVALSGRVYVQADASFGAIKPGDMLTTSNTPGHAMKVGNHAKAQGAILGKAMSALKEGKGMVLVLVTLQ